MGLLDIRNAYTDISTVGSTFQWETGRDGAGAIATIAIPTFRRLETLLEAIESGLGQDCTFPYDVIVADNGGDPQKAVALKTRFETHSRCRLRYFLNDENLGMFGNWNRCIELAQSEWITILNDDDLLRPGFLSRCFALIRRNSRIDGLVCAKTFRDRRANLSNAIPARRPARRPGSVLLAALHRATFLRGAAKVSPRRLFFGNHIGNTAGFLFRRSAALQLGGFDPQQWPSADFLFYMRMSMTGRLYWMRDVLAEVGLGDNESLDREVLMDFVVQLQKVREALAGDQVPASWLGLSPTIVANHVSNTERLWGERLDLQDVAGRVGFAIPPADFRRESRDRVLRGIF